jgi:hypothetical protein
MNSSLTSDVSFNRPPYENWLKIFEEECDMTISVKHLCLSRSDGSVDIKPH